SAAGSGAGCLATAWTSTGVSAVSADGDAVAGEAGSAGSGLAGGGGGASAGRSDSGSRFALASWMSGAGVWGSGATGATAVTGAGGAGELTAMPITTPPTSRAAAAVISGQLAARKPLRGGADGRVMAAPAFGGRGCAGAACAWVAP